MYHLLTTQTNTKTLQYISMNELKKIFNYVRHFEIDLHLVHLQHINKIMHRAMQRNGYMVDNGWQVLKVCFKQF